MRGNNIPFSHAVAFHEMIPGHNLVGYMGARYGSYRARIGGSTPFFGEGWPLYWELLMYDMGFHDTPEERVGALFWRMHRCARIIFSLNFHMGIWSPQESIDFLVDKVGHERDNATAEVRRSFQGGYGPLYQAAYLLGGLQLRGTAQGARRLAADDEQAVPRRDHAPGQHADRAHPAGADQAEADARHVDRLEVLRRSAGAVNSTAPLREANGARWPSRSSKPVAGRTCAGGLGSTPRRFRQPSLACQAKLPSDAARPQVGCGSAVS